MTATTQRRPFTQEEIVERVLNAPAEVSAAELGRQLGLSRESIRRVRLGTLYGGVLPHLPRHGNYVASRRCWQCQIAVRQQQGNQRMRMPRRDDVELDLPWCSLSIPESVNAAFARECPLFEPMT